MKRYFIVIFILSLLVSVPLQAQNQATDYFPTGTGYKWIFKNQILDTLNNPLDTGVTYTVDSFALNVTYKGKSAKGVLSKSGPGATLSFQPYLDTNYINLSGTDGFVFFKVANANEIISGLGSGGFDTILAAGFLRLLNSFENWYSIYRFNNTVNSDYQVFRYDTTITFDTVTLPMRFEVKERRLNDQNITTELGTFTCKKFLQTFSMSYLLALPPPLPPLAVPIITIKDSIWLAPNRWVVQSVTPSSRVDLSILGLPAFTLPGSKTVIVNQLPTQVSVRERDQKQGSTLVLYPQPATDRLILTSLIGTTDEISAVNIYSVTGELLASVKIAQSDNQNIDLSNQIAHLSSGVYFVCVQRTSGTVILKFIKSKI